MAPEQKQQLKEFEERLDAASLCLLSRQWGSTATLHAASELFEVGAFQNGPDNAGFLDRGYSILASHFVAGSAGEGPEPSKGTDLRQIMDDLAFASHYFMIREYLYYSYNVPGSMSWSFSADRVEVRFADPSIPRQFFTIHNDQILGSKHHFRDFNHSAEIMQLLKDEPEGVVTPNFEAADLFIQREADLKLAAYFSLIPIDSQIDLGGYTYEQFFELYRMLLIKALYHRYLARAQNAVGAIYMPEKDLLRAAEEELGIPLNVAERILKDLVYDKGATGGRVDASYFSLMREGEAGGQIVMRPHHFATAEGLVNVLRVIAQRRPRTFLDQASNLIGNAFVQRVKSAWESEGFICRSEVSLREYDPSLPDIDLLVISVEPTLGYVIYVCELKSPIPPRWAKDQLRVLNKDSISKAFRQLEALRKFIRTEQGIRFLSRMLPGEGHPNYENFVVALDYLVITSDNAGMFFGTESVKVINFRTLERLLRRSDGDMQLIQEVLATYAENADAALVTTMAEFRIGDLTVAYEGVTEGPLLEFPQGNWRSWSERDEAVKAFIADGLHPHHVFEHRAPDAVVIDHTKRPRK
ncbi:hypothetical protein LJR245_007307 [Rhizobium leguminosarum]|uniref:hypothetical protein n=1 Tax=Rhizobium leguminosarum TaxID=384 RepID=UPI00143F85D9|nr:hypothetical protein [Rhizobium leguminosarum]MBY5840926.1 hypothetical protein [Rhizobium leguminosarum]MBY5869200.1 hypothetical protein [Rhizobium leguminosarum]MCA2410835.1 hypothetical protein [Rhizobium leguminosarum]NKK77977.1 hypothetical protein [Rhizobium leguminosarum bv. viciae]NKL08822.1 hypothetical protein [Rhizobium leguminosarum bv. viciae]